ncbi:butyrophilin subfamily 1 member A1-like isoform X1, partial [Clarias magur]
MTLLPHFIGCKESLKVFGPDVPLGAVAGKDLVLPCFIKPSTSIVDMRVQWVRLDAVNSLVHLYEDHKDRNEDQAESYRGRTSLFKEELQKGNASLKFSALRVSDEGEYQCLIEDKSWSDDISIYVTVEAHGSHPVIMMETYDNSGGINLVCESRGWKYEPDVLWLDREGAPLTAEETQTHRDTEGLTVKRRITVYDYSNSNRFYCRLLQGHHIMEADVIISGKVFDTWKWIVGLSVSACLIAVGWIVTAVILHKKEPQRQKVEREFTDKKNFAELQSERMKHVLAAKKKFA